MSDNSTIAKAQYLTFVLDKKLFAFDVLKTREVLSLIPITTIPGTSAQVSGVLNLRGSVVPVIDLRKKFVMNESPYSEDTSIIIVESNVEEDVIIVGALVDAVKGVRVFDQSQIEPPPKLGMKLSLDMIHAIGKTEKDFTLILNVDKIFSDEDLAISQELIETADAVNITTE